MQNIILTQTAGGTTSVTIYANLVQERITKQYKNIPLPTSTRSTTSSINRAIDLGKFETAFLIKGHFEDEERTSLDGSHTAAVTTITVGSTTGFATSGLIKVEQELISYTGTTATTFTGCTRGLEGTVARAYNSGAKVFLPATQFRDNLYSIIDYGGAFKLEYRRKNWSVVLTSLTMSAEARDVESPTTFDIDMTLMVGQDILNKSQSLGLVTGRN